MYRWRKLSPEERERILLGRQRRGYPWHSPPHRPSAFTGSYHIRAADREIRGEAHRWATINYIHHNPVHHGYARQWQDWPWSSARGFLAAVGYDAALRLWRAYPLRDYGAKWDSAER